MSEMVKRAAYAIALYEMRLKTPKLAAFCEANPEARALAVAQAVETYAGTARAVIEAIREPTEAMGKAADRPDFWVFDDRLNGDQFAADVCDIYRAMIDAALKDAP